jgi:hypothetical protein
VRCVMPEGSVGALKDNLWVPYNTCPCLTQLRFEGNGWELTVRGIPDL